MYAAVLLRSANALRLFFPIIIFLILTEYNYVPNYLFPMSKGRAGKNSTFLIIDDATFKKYIPGRWRS